MTATARVVGGWRGADPARGWTVVVEPHYFIGLDLGQSHDYTALVVVERRGGGGRVGPGAVRASEGDSG